MSLFDVNKNKMNELLKSDNKFRSIINGKIVNFLSDKSKELFSKQITLIRDSIITSSELNIDDIKDHFFKVEKTMILQDVIKIEEVRVELSQKLFIWYMEYISCKEDKYYIGSIVSNEQGVLTEASLAILGKENELPFEIETQVECIRLHIKTYQMVKQDSFKISFDVKEVNGKFVLYTYLI